MNDAVSKCLSMALLILGLLVYLHPDLVEAKGHMGAAVGRTVGRAACINGDCNKQFMGWFFVSCGLFSILVLYNKKLYNFIATRKNGETLTEKEVFWDKTRCVILAIFLFGFGGLILGWFNL
jgi:hypothetical protein